MRSVLVLLVALLLLTKASADVVELTSQNFDEVAGKDAVTFIKFFAPWCGHCKKVAPEFLDASQIVKNMTFGEVDCEKEKKLCETHEIHSFPKLFLFRKGAKLSEYSGQRTASAISDFVKLHLLPDSTSVSSDEEFEKLKSENPRICLIKTKSNETKLAELVSKLIPNYKSTYHFVMATDKKVSPDDSMESVTVYRKNDDKEVFDGDISSDALTAFLEKAAVMFLGSLSSETLPYYSKFASESAGVVLLGSENVDEHFTDIKLAAKKHRKDLIFIAVDSATDKVAKNMGLPENAVYPAFVISSKTSVYSHPTDIKANSTTIDAFIEQYKKGEIAPLLKSDPVPKEPTKDGLTIFVGSTLDSYIKKGKDMMVYIYAPWCGHCKNFHPIYEEFAKAYGSNDLIIGKIDGTTNDFNATLFKVEGFPTLYFIPAGNQEAMLYDGERTVEELAAFVKKNMKGFAQPKNEDTEDGDL